MPIIFQGKLKWKHTSQRMISDPIIIKHANTEHQLSTVAYSHIEFRIIMPYGALLGLMGYQISIRRVCDSPLHFFSGRSPDQGAATLETA